jgi:hypothetical protein
MKRKMKMVKNRQGEALLPMLYQVPRHEDVWRSVGGIAPRILILGTVEVNVQLHAPADLPREKVTPVPIG